MKTKMDENMEEIFNLPESSEEITGELVSREETLPAIVTSGKDEKEIDEDLKYARNNIRDIIGSGRDALEEIAALAAASQSPRAYEVYTSLLKAIVESNKDLLEIQKNKKELKKKETEQTNHNSIQNALFVGSTKELQEFLKKTDEK